ncbi:unnamed protein product [Schistocephalus solidus]|uniref:Vesicle transport protein n=1 Tax=Schistocephalus solidus TaxID=70667 RepID=A0A183TIH3_SCHSO|nr:unnamed protein product [Schistocephalus solidus]
MLGSFFSDTPSSPAASKSKSGAVSSSDYSLPPILEGFLKKPSVGRYPSPSSSVLIPSSDSCDTPNSESRLSSGVQSVRRFFSFVPAPADSYEPEIFRSLSRRQRLFYFVASLLCASLLFSFSLIFIPLLATPSGMRKFVLMYVLGNVALLVSLAFAYGPCGYLKSLLTPQRFPSTAIYCFSLFMGLYGVLVWRSAACAALALITQVGLAFWNLRQFVYSGGKIFSFFSKVSSVPMPGIWESSSTLPV